MNDYPEYHDEEKRLAAVRQSHILDTPQEEAYTSLVELIASIADCPISLISIMDKDRQWFKALKGLEESETTREIAFCNHTIVQDGLFIVEDALKDERFANNPFVTGPANIRFYAGVPFKSPDGYPLGTVCVLDTEPKQLSPAKRNALQLVADQVAELVWLRTNQEQATQQKAEVERQQKQQFEEQQAMHEAVLSRIGNELHEDYAQSIAACMKFMELAQVSTEITQASILRTQSVLHDLLQKMRELSAEINPSHHDALKAD